MSRYQHIFFDLDHTLWDFERNSRETLKQIFENFHLDAACESAADFIEAYERINEQLWAQYRAGRLDKPTLRNSRFKFVLESIAPDLLNLATDMNEYYLHESPRKPHLMPGAAEILDALAEQYPLHIITNGFEEVQQVKMKVSGLEPYFNTRTISEKIGVLKPHPKVFLSALELANAKSMESIYVGDHLESDVLGSKNVGMDQVYFNPSKVEHGEQPTYEISKLLELKEVFL
jgi:putative hydrolase of the HAD superfamily